MTIHARIRRAVLAAALVTGLAACTGPADQPASTDSPSTTGSAPTTEPPSTGPATITLAFAGDVHFEDRTRPLLGSPATALGPVSKVLSAADVALVNLESAVTTRGTPEPKRFHFRAPASAYTALAAAGVDVVSIANNHALDYGRQGLADTIAAAKAAGMPAIGAGANATEAYTPWITEVKGVTIAYLGFSQIQELSSSWIARDDRPGVAMSFDKARAIAAVKAAKQQADVVVVYMHWGYETQQCPNGEQKAFAKAVADAGATMILGTHAHLLLGDGWMGDTYVQYGLGNFLWWRNDAYSNDTGVLEVTLTGDKITKTQLIPAVIDRSTGQPIPVSGAEAARVSRKYANLRACTGLKPGPSA